MGFVWETVWHSCCDLRYCRWYVLYANILIIFCLRDGEKRIIIISIYPSSQKKHISFVVVECTTKCEGGISPFLYHNCSMNKFIEMLYLVIYFDWIWRKIISETSFCIIRYETREGMTWGTKDFECDTFSQSIRRCSCKKWPKTKGY